MASCIPEEHPGVLSPDWRGCLELQRAAITVLQEFTFCQHFSNSTLEQYKMALGPRGLVQLWPGQGLTEVKGTDWVWGLRSTGEGGPQGRGPTLLNSAVHSKESWATPTPLAYQGWKSEDCLFHQRYRAQGCAKAGMGLLKPFTVIHWVHQAVNIALIRGCNQVTQP